MTIKVVDTATGLEVTSAYVAGPVTGFSWGTTPGLPLMLTASENYLNQIEWSQRGQRFFGSAVGTPKEKIRIEPLETPVPSREPTPTPETVERPVVEEPVAS